jgi:hypothetical protein
MRAARSRSSVCTTQNLRIMSVLARPSTKDISLFFGVSGTRTWCRNSSERT